MKLIILTFFCIFNLSAQDIENTIPGDPFTEFDDSANAIEEENLERFFSFGRFLHIRGFGSMAMPMGPLSSIYLPGYGFGGSISYFIDWNISINFEVSLDLLPIEIIFNGGEITGSAYLSTTRGVVKYYFNFFDISKFISKLNPFLKIGAGLYILSDSIDVNNTIEAIGYSPAQTSIVPGVLGGLGIEYDIYQKMFLLGLEATYHYTLFSSENPNIDPSDELLGSLGLDYSGSFLIIAGSLILNFN